MAKDTVDDYLAISMRTLKELGCLEGGGYPRTLRWTRCGVQIGSRNILVWTRDGVGTLTVYSYKGMQPLSHEVKLVSTPCHYGGLRWWFLCPLWRSGRLCGRRVGVLYLGQYPGCRCCYDLTYWSCQHSRKFDSAGMIRMMKEIGEL